MISRPAPRRMIGRLLLSLALLWAQQAAISHTQLHPAQNLRAATAGSDMPSNALFETHACGDCLAYAQFFSALGNPHHALALAAPAPLRLAMPATQDGCIATVCMYQPRAPPLG